MSQGVASKWPCGFLFRTRRIVRRGITVVMVEHDMDSVMRISDRIRVLKYGEVVASGSPAQVERDLR
jgi:branched-chain amino acid transport system ATP-binding protein